MFAKPTINDFFDNARWHVKEAIARINKLVGRMKAEHAGRGILQSSMTHQRTFQIVKEEFDATIRIVFGELKRTIRITDLDPREVRQAALQCLDDFSRQAKAIIQGSRIPSIPDSAIAKCNNDLDQELEFVRRQFDVGFLSPSEPEVPQVNNAITIGTMTGSTIQQGSPSANQNVQFALRIEDAKLALTALEAALAEAALPPAAQADVSADLQTIKAQLSKPTPSLQILREAGKSARSMLEGGAAGLLAPHAFTAATALWSALGLG
jgi:hypothetical protein